MNKKKEIMHLLDESMVIEDTVIMMKGLSVMFDEFIMGSTIINDGSDPRLAVIENRITDMMLFAIKTLSAGADRLQTETADLQNRILDVLSDDSEV